MELVDPVPSPLTVPLLVAVKIEPRGGQLRNEVEGSQPRFPSSEITQFIPW